MSEEFTASGQVAAFRAGRDVLSPNVQTMEIDLSTERSAAKGTALTFRARGVSFFSAPVNADLGITEAGAIKITGDKRASETAAPNSFWIMPGTAMRNYPFEKLTIENPAQPGRKCYLHWSMSVDFASQIFTPAVEAATGRAEVVRFGDPNDSDVFNRLATFPNGIPSFYFIGFQEDRVKRELQDRLNARATGAAGIVLLDDAVGRDCVFTKQGQTFYYRLTGDVAQFDLRSLIAENKRDQCIAKFRFTLIDVGSPAPSGHVHVLSAEVYNKWGVYECNPLVNPDTTQTNAGSVETAVEASRFESPWLIFWGSEGQAPFYLRMQGNAQFTDRSPPTFGASLLIDVEYCPVNP